MCQGEGAKYPLTPSTTKPTFRLPWGTYQALIIGIVLVVTGLIMAIFGYYIPFKYHKQLHIFGGNNKHHQNGISINHSDPGIEAAAAATLTTTMSLRDLLDNRKNSTTTNFTAHQVDGDAHRIITYTRYGFLTSTITTYGGGSYHKPPKSHFIAQKDKFAAAITSLNNRRPSSNSEWNELKLTILSYAGPCFMGIGCIILVIVYVVTFESRDREAKLNKLMLMCPSISIGGGAPMAGDATGGEGSPSLGGGSMYGGGTNSDLSRQYYAASHQPHRHGGQREVTNFPEVYAKRYKYRKTTVQQHDRLKRSFSFDEKDSMYGSIPAGLFSAALNDDRLTIVDFKPNVLYAGDLKSSGTRGGYDFTCDASKHIKTDAGSPSLYTQSPSSFQSSSNFSYNPSASGNSNNHSHHLHNPIQPLSPLITLAKTGDNSSKKEYAKIELVDFNTPSSSRGTRTKVYDGYNKPESVDAFSGIHSRNRMVRQERVSAQLNDETSLSGPPTSFSFQSDSFEIHHSSHIPSPPSTSSHGHRYNGKKRNAKKLETRYITKRANKTSPNSSPSTSRTYQPHR